MVAARGVRAVALNARIGETFVNVDVTVAALETGVRAITLVTIQEV